MIFEGLDMFGRGAHAVQSFLDRRPSDDLLAFAILALSSVRIVDICR